MSCGGVSLSSLSSFHTMAAATPQEPPRMQRVLVFGGNGFLGGATVERMLAAGHYQVVTVNRGNWYWDSAFVVKPHVTQVTCDRLYPLERCEQLVNMVKDEGFDVVVDFSAYHPDAVTGALKVSWIGPSGTGTVGWGGGGGDDNRVSRGDDALTRCGRRHWGLVSHSEAGRFLGGVDESVSVLIR